MPRGIPVSGFLFGDFILAHVNNQIKLSFMPAELFAALQSLPMAHWLIYLAVFLPVGFFMNQFGKWTNIACFTYWWQVITCYGFYLTPIAVALRFQPFFLQYLWGFFFLGILEFFGYALGTSRVLGIREEKNLITIENNILIRFVNIKNFALSMSIFFGLYIPAGNWLVAKFIE